MQAAIIVDGTVDNIIEIDSLDVLPGLDLVDATGAQIGDLWDGAQFITPAAPAPDLADLRVEKNAQINEWRGAANLSTFPHAGKLVACDELSRSDIDGVANNIALFGAFPAGFPGAWKAVDNTLIPLADVDAFRALYASMTAQGTENFNHAQALKAKLANASTPDQIAAIQWSDE